MVVVEGRTAVSRSTFALDPARRPPNHLLPSQGTDGMPRFQWIERLAGLAPLAPSPSPEIEFILFPGEATLQRVDRPGTRLFKLHFAADAGRSLYLWPQEPDAASDARTLATFNAAMADEGEGGYGMEEEEEGDWEGGGGSAPPAGGARVTAAALAAALRGAGMPPPPGAPPPAVQPGATVDAAALAAALAGATGSAPPPPPRAGPSLGDVLAPDAVLPLVRLPGMLEALAPHLPDTQRDQAGLEAMVRSAQFREQVDKLSTALATGALSLATLGLPGEGHSVAALLRAVQASVDTDKEKQTENEGGGGGSGPAGG